jgi:hypothetical protein
MGHQSCMVFPPSTAAFHVINNIRDYNKKGQLKKELSALYLQKYTIKEVLSRDSQVLSALMNLKSHGIMEDRILYLNKLLEKAQYAPLKTNAAFPEIKFGG